MHWLALRLFLRIQYRDKYVYYRCTSLDGQTIYVQTLALLTACPARARPGTPAPRCDIIHLLIELGHGQALLLGPLPALGPESYNQFWP